MTAITGPHPAAISPGRQPRKWRPSAASSRIGAMSPDAGRASGKANAGPADGRPPGRAR